VRDSDAVTNCCRNPQLVWIYPSELDAALDAATWLETTRELRRVGWHVTLLCAGNEDVASIGGVKVQCLARPDVYLLRQVVFHLKVIRFLWAVWAQTDVVLVHENSVPWILFLRLLRGIGHGARPRLVMDSRSLSMPSRSPGNFRETIKRLELETMNKLGNRLLDGRLAITGRLAKALHIPEHKLWGTWPSGAAIDFFATARAVRDWPSDEGPIHVIYHGALHRERNLVTLGKAVLRANDKGMSFSLLLLGEGTDWPRLDELASSSNGTLRLAARVPYLEVPRVLAWAHVGVVPFADEEKFRVSSPIKLFEYMAAGIPILATRIVCHTDVVGEAKYIFWAEDADEDALVAALTLVWNSRSSLAWMGHEAELASRSWSWAASAEKLAAALERGIRETGKLFGGSQSEAVGVR
jgi:glycosyltransferase involved in cell wall biosynthesis